jgi:hypothetical protein
MFDHARRVIGRAGPWRGLGAWVLIAVTATLVTLTIRYRHLQMDRDEANHARQGQIIAVAAGDHQATELLEWFQQPHGHPPGHGMLLASWFLLWGTSVLSARLYSVLCFLLLGLVIWKWAADQCPSNQHRLAFLPVLWLVTDPQYIANATLSMLELPAALWTAVALWLHTRALGRADRSGRRWDTLAALAATLAFMIRYSFGIPLIAALCISHVSCVVTTWVRPGDRAARSEASYRLAIFVVCTGAVIGGWLFGLRQLAPLLHYSGAQPETVVRWSLENLVYYPRELARANIASSLLACAFVIGLGWSLWRRNLGAVELVLLVYLALVFVELFLVRQKALRFGMPFGPALWIVTARMLERMLAAGPAWLREPAPPRRMLALGGIAMLIGGLAFADILGKFPNQYENVNSRIHRAYLDITKVIAPWKRPATTIVLFQAKDHWPGTALAFHLIAACEAHHTRCDVTVWDRDLPPEGLSQRSTPDEIVDRASAIATADFAISYRKFPKEEPGLLNRPVLFQKDYACKVVKAVQPPTTRRAKVTILGPLPSVAGLADKS